MAFNRANFSAPGSASFTWTVSATQQEYFYYAFLGELLLISFKIHNTMVTGNPALLMRYLAKHGHEKIAKALGYGLGAAGGAAAVGNLRVKKPVDAAVPDHGAAVRASCVCGIRNERLTMTHISTTEDVTHLLKGGR